MADPCILRLAEGRLKKVCSANIVMKIKRNYAGFFCLSLLLLLISCSKSQVGSLPGNDNAVVGRAAWSQLAEVEKLRADAILSWRAVNGEHGKYRVRLFVAVPDKLKIQWLTPWGSVAGQLLIADKNFWLANAREKQTWYGRTADIDKLLQNPGFKRNGADFQTVAVNFCKYWPLLFSLPAADDRNFADEVAVEYFTYGDGDELSFGKSVTTADGTKMHIRLFALEELSNKRLLPRAVEILSKSGKVGIRLRHYSLTPDFTARTFTYGLRNFTMYECL